ncbi:hypothetical protein B6U79_03760 [Candidatus Bathyarchaeota archaeon ex4484_231]|nr:MAG: hypothetical protein B6U79_03760 [Candidatus Bathyarchaeota archaeon ex4484_231]
MDSASRKVIDRNLLAAQIRDGYLPFTLHLVDPEDVSSLSENFRLQPHQKEALNAFMKGESTGIYWPAGQRKPFSAQLYAR